MKKYFFIIFIFLFPTFAFTQTSTVQNASIPKDAPVDVTVSDFKNNTRANEIIVFRSKANEKEYQGLTDNNGKFSLRLPAGD